MPYYTYILYSEKNDRYYVGSSSDVEKRLLRHNAGSTKSTKSGRPWEIVHVETFPDKAEAQFRERFIKKMKSRRFIESLIQNS